MKRVESRYQFFSKNGVEWTEWFILMGEPVGTESECKDRIRVLKKASSKGNTKLRREFRVVEAANVRKEGCLW